MHRQTRISRIRVGSARIHVCRWLVVATMRARSFFSVAALALGWRKYMLDENVWWRWGMDPEALSAGGKLKSVIMFLSMIYVITWVLLEGGGGAYPPHAGFVGGWDGFRFRWTKLWHFVGGTAFERDCMLGDWLRWMIYAFRSVSGHLLSVALKRMINCRPQIEIQGDVFQIKFLGWFLVWY